MKCLQLIAFFTITSRITTLPVDDRIYFPNEVDYSVDDLRVDHTKLFTEVGSKILPTDNNTKEFLVDEKQSAALESGDFYQGDIVLTAEQKKFFEEPISDDPFGTRTGIIGEDYRWPKNHEGKVIVPYEVSDKYSWADRIRIWWAMRDIEKHTCVYFKSKDKEQDYVKIETGQGCSSNLGRIGGMQEVTLKRKGCMSRGTIIHELIHALGYDHMHSHSDRDDFVNIIWDNIDRRTYPNFQKVDPRRFSNFGTPYDYYSVMHYGPTAFSKNGLRTIVPRDPKARNVIGQRVGMSEGDKQRINNMYHCRVK